MRELTTMTVEEYAELCGGDSFIATNILTNDKCRMREVSQLQYTYNHRSIKRFLIENTGIVISVYQANRNFMVVGGYNED